MVLSDNVNNKNEVSDSPTNGEHDERHLCLDCGYDLRGHDCDPIRCPECGGENTLDDLAIATTLTEDDFKEFETGPTTAIACFLCMAGGMAFLFSGMLGCSVVLLLPATVVWLVAIRNFGRKHRFRYGWVDVLIWFHATVVAILLAIGAVVVGEERIRFRTKLGDLVVELAFWVIVAVSWSLLPTVWNPYAIAKRKLAMLAKRTAVEKKKREV